ncbi:hypothetical protein ODJ79_17910 [Actinoplanes sp. KI2]|uniref:hypothetical protein n=1 Tax=Actinoplanes sp. KI2 TaxID=2983315 RepID=UPI0021D5826F|nr:hypothetical protein [Actinoplanes sp. KI2]MCU7725608.1 hypothetical protein [Actinoplanes sp. KI2]
MITEGLPDEMGSSRAGRGKSINRQAWPESGVRRDWLIYCDRVHRANGLPSLRSLAAAMGLTSASRVGEMLRGLALPADEAQARALLEALGAVGAETERGVRRYLAVRTEQDGAARDTDGLGSSLESRDVEPIGEIAQREPASHTLKTWQQPTDPPPILGTLPYPPLPVEHRKPPGAMARWAMNGGIRWYLPLCLLFIGCPPIGVGLCALVFIQTSLADRSHNGRNAALIGSGIGLGVGALYLSSLLVSTH